MGNLEAAAVVEWLRAQGFAREAEVVAATVLPPEPEVAPVAPPKVERAKKK